MTRRRVYALFALLAVLVVVRLALVSVVASTTSGGCDHIPLVHGHPAYACASQP